MTDARVDLDAIESALLPITGLILSAPVLPGFLLCVPALSMVAFVLLVPLAVVALLLAVAGTLLAIPVLLVRAVRSRRVPTAPERVGALAADM
jgi:hypothetical protein